MSEITMKKMRKWLKEKIKCDTEWVRHIKTLDAFETDETSPSYSETEYNIKIMRAILAALERPPLEKSWMKQAEELNVPFSAVKIIRDKIMEEAALEEKGNPLYMHNWLKDDAVCYDLPAEEIIQTLAEENSAMEKEINRLQAALGEPGEEERKELVYHFDKHISFIIGGKDACPTCVKIRAVILGKGAGE